MTANKSVIPTSGNFDLCFYDFNFTDSMLALAALQSGLKVLIVIDQSFDWDFDPEIVTLYPVQFKGVFRSVRNIKYFEKISSLFPSLVYPQRILTLSEGKKFRVRTVSLIDFFLKRDREIASLPINFSKFPSFQIFSNRFQNGLLVQEFSFDRYKAIIDMLLICKSLGAKIISNASASQHEVKENSFFTCLPIQCKTRKLIIENFRFNFSNNIHIETNGLEITSKVQELKTCLYFRLKRNIAQDDFLTNVLSLLKSIGVESAEMYQNELITIYYNIRQDRFHNITDKQLLYDHNISVSEINCRKDARRISKAIGKNIRLNKMIKSLKNNRFDGIGFRQLQAECDEKFDLAKQTGINYESFCYFFYRYRLSIDELIELAYLQMDTNRTNPQMVWKLVEQDFQKKIEEEIFY